VPAELHVYQFGPHGVGLAPGDPALNTWKDRLYDWLKKSGFLAEVTRAPVNGKISLQGQPLKWGQIRFTPESPNAPVASAMVNKGKYQIDAAHGPVLGKNTVEVISMGDVAPQPTTEDARPVTRAGVITFNIASEQNVFDLDLKD